MFISRVGTAEPVAVDEQGHGSQGGAGHQGNCGQSGRHGEGHSGRGEAWAPPPVQRGHGGLCENVPGGEAAEQRAQLPGAELPVNLLGGNLHDPAAVQDSVEGKQGPTGGVRAGHLPTHARPAMASLMARTIAKMRNRR